VKTTGEGQAAARGGSAASTADGAIRSERRAHLIVLAGELFAQKGYRATTVREIADAAGILSGSPGGGRARGPPPPAPRSSRSCAPPA
jgi:hypothetical protein